MQPPSFQNYATTLFATATTRIKSKIATIWSPPLLGGFLLVLNYIGIFRTRQIASEPKLSRLALIGRDEAGRTRASLTLSFTNKASPSIVISQAKSTRLQRLHQNNNNMAFQQQLSPEEQAEMAQYDAICAFRDQILAGTHLRVKVPEEFVS